MNFGAIQSGMSRSEWEEWVRKDKIGRLMNMDMKDKAIQ